MSLNIQLYHCLTPDETYPKTVEVGRDIPDPACRFSTGGEWFRLDDDAEPVQLELAEGSWTIVGLDVSESARLKADVALTFEERGDPKSRYEVLGHLDVPLIREIIPPE